MSDPEWLSSGTLNSNEPSAVTTSFKVILIGEVGVGKTAIFNKARHQDHVMSGVTSSSSTIGIDTCTRTFSTRFGNVTLNLWDTAGVERFRTLTRNYYRNTHGALLVFSLHDPSSLFYLPRWRADIMDSAPSATLYLVGNKSDLDQEVPDNSIQSFADAHNCQAAFLTSAVTGDGVEAALRAVCEDLVTRYHRHSDMTDQHKLWMEGSGIHVHGSVEHDVRKCC